MKKNAVPSAENTAHRAYEHLLLRVSMFQTPPGERLNEVEIASQLAMSRAPVREALNRLLSEGLVNFEPGKGFYCRKLSAAEVVQLFEARADLECGSLTTLCQLADQTPLRAFATRYRVLDAGIAQMDIDALVALDELFHQELSALAGNVERMRYLANINLRIRFVRRINLESDERRRESMGEHLTLLDAILARDLPRATTILRHHLELSVDEARSKIAIGLSKIYAEDIT